VRECFLNVTLPVFNEASCLRESVSRVVRMLDTIEESFEVVIVDNGSTDETPQLAKRLAEEDPRIRMIRLEKAGRGAAIKRSWLLTRAQIVSYMDIDLSTDLACFPALIAPLRRQEAPLVVGSRLHKDADVSRCWHRDSISRIYVKLVQHVLGDRLSDFQCGFKAADRRTIGAILPLVQNDSWFFDTELVFVAKRLGFRVSEVPVRWNEDRDSRVRILPTILEDLLGICRLRWDSMGK